MRDRLTDWAGVGPEARSAEVVRGAYRSLAEAPCSVLTATLDDAMVVEERPNLPGTVDAWPNWRIALPRPLEEIEALPLAAELATVLSRPMQGSGPGPDGRRP